MNLKGIGREDVEWIQLAQDYGPVAGSSEHLNDPGGYKEGREYLDQLSYD
jgi:hypothetical protein